MSVSVFNHSMTCLYIQYDLSVHVGVYLNQCKECERSQMNQGISHQVAGDRPW